MTTSNNTPDWAPECTWSIEDIQQRVAQSPVTLDGPIHALAEGFDNYIFNTPPYYLRITRRQIAVPDIHKEVRLLPYLQSRLDTNIPNIIYAPDLEETTWPWFIFEPVKGMEASQLLLNQPLNEQVAQNLGQCLNQLHSNEVYQDTKTWVREDTYRRTDMPYRAKSTLRHLETLHAQHPLDIDALKQICHDAQPLGVMPHTALVHGDLHMRHVMLDEQHQLSGIIDWGDAHIGHPSCDFYPYWSLFSPSARRAFLEAYGPVDEQTLIAGRLVATYINVILALSADDFGLPHLKKAALNALEHIVCT